MKKLIAIIVSAAMVFGISAAALADDAIDDENAFSDEGIQEVDEDKYTEDENGEDENEEDEGTDEDVPEYIDIEEDETVLPYITTGNWTYTLIHEYTVTNHNRYVAFNIEVETPLPDNVLPVYTQLDGEVLSPSAMRIKTDGYGHRFAVYNIDRLYGNQTAVLTQRFVMDVSSINYTFDRANVEDDYSEGEMRRLMRYLLAENEMDPGDTTVKTFTQRTINGMTDPYQKARALFSAVNLYLQYDNSELMPEDASSVLARGTANCQGYCNLYVSCLRAAGVAARRQNGYIYMPQIHTTEEYVDPVNGRIRMNELRHSWVEFYLPGIGWIAADPTYTYTYEMGGGVQKFVDWSYFAQIDTQRRYLTFREGSLNDEIISFSYEAAGDDIEIEFNSYLQPGAHFEGFTDIDGHWAQEAVSYCVGNGLFNGVGNNRFAPESTMTRAMFVTVLGRLYELLGNATDTFIAPGFIDVDNNSYYAHYLAWAVENRLVNGYGGGRFGPDDPVTRQQMAKMMADFAEKMGVNIHIYDGAYLSFRDADMVAPWANTAVAWCSNTGLITGLPGNSFAPDDNATRAQVATIIQRTAQYFQR